jgi:hypothetical protein
MTMVRVDVADVRLEYIAYMEEESDFVESRLLADDILFSFLFAPVSRQSPAGASRQPETDIVPAEAPEMAKPGV